MQQVMRERESLRRAGSLDRNVKLFSTRSRVINGHRLDAPGRRDLKFVSMLPNYCNPRAGRCQNLRAQQAEFAVANDDNSCVFSNRGSLKNSAGGGQWFGKHRPLVRDFVRHRQQIHRRQFQELSMRAITPDDPQNGSRRAVARIARTTELAAATPGVDLADDTLTGCQQPDRQGGLAWPRRPS